MLNIFYDGHCPLCAAEMSHLKKFDTNNLITLVDIHQPNFEDLYPNIQFSDAMKILHGQYNGEILLGLEVTHRAWTLVGKGFWVAPLNWPVIKTVSHWVYLGLAKYRHQISSFLAKTFNMKTIDCSNGTCNAKTLNNHNKRQ